MWQNSKCDKTQKFKVLQNLNTQMWQNKTTQCDNSMWQLKNSKCDRTKKPKM